MIDPGDLSQRPPPVVHTIDVPRFVDPWWHTAIVTLGTIITTMLKLSLTLIAGALLALLGLYYLTLTYPDQLIESWRWTDGHGEVWDCLRLPGTMAQCQIRREGELVFYAGELPQFSPCTVVERQYR